MYTNYQILSINTLFEYNDSVEKFRTKNFTVEEKSNNEKKTALIIRRLGIFECIRVFFELVIASFRSCTCNKQPFLNEAWTALKNRQWVRIIKLKNFSSSGKVSNLIDHFQKPQAKDANLVKPSDQHPSEKPNTKFKDMPPAQPILKPSTEPPVKPIPKINAEPIANPNSKPNVEPIAKPILKPEVKPIVNVKKFDFSNAEIRKQFEEQLINIIQTEEKSEEIKATNNSSPKFREKFVNTCLECLSLLDPLEDAINLERIDTILENPLEMTAFAKGLSSENNHTLLLKLLQKERQNVEGPTAKEKRTKRLAALFKVLSESQFDEMIKSGEFLEMCGVKECREAITQSFTAEQLGKFASSWKNGSLKKNSLGIESLEKFQNYLKETIKSLPSNDLLLGKLIAILPHLSQICKKDFIEQIAHLPLKSRPGFPYDPADVKASKHHVFIEMLEALTLYYIKENDLQITAFKTEILESFKLSARQAKPQKHYEVSTGHLNTVYNTEEVKKAPTFDQAKLAQLIQALEASNPDFDQIRITLSLMDKSSIESFIQSASPKALKAFWQTESKTLNAKSMFEDRSSRLKWVFAALSDDQIKASIKLEDFLKILTDDQNGNSAAAGEAFTVEQLALIASNWETHVQFIKVIVKFSDEKFVEFLPWVMPHCTPFLKNALFNRIDRAYRRNPQIRKQLKEQVEVQCNKALAESEAKDKKLSQAWWQYYRKNSSWL